jgi:hypothetical protein
VSAGDNPTIININIGGSTVPQVYSPSQYQDRQPFVKQQIAKQKRFNFLDFDIDNYWIATAGFALATLLMFYPSVDARIFTAWRGDAASGNIESSPIPDSDTPNVSPQTAEEGRKRIAQIALADARSGLHYKVGQSARCADYVDRVLRLAGWNTRDTITKQPIDNLRDTGKYMANRFFGGDIGEIIKNPKDLRPGDLVAFRNTYGNWGKGAITHVGIYVGDGKIVDRGTASAPVLHRSIYTFDKGGETKFSAGVRLKGRWFMGVK